MLNSPRHLVGEAQPAHNSISIAIVEDRVNTARNAARLALGFVENCIDQSGPGNIANYAIGHACEVIEEAHKSLRAFMAQEFASRRVEA